METPAIPRSIPVVLLIFMMACSQVGTVKSIGIYLGEISHSLGTTSEDIGVALGLFTAFSYFPAPLIVAIYRLPWTRRALLILGSSFISLGVILTSTASSNALVAVYLSISGFGHCMVDTAATIALSQLTNEQNFSLFFSVGMSGFGLGMVLLPFLADILGEVYGWRGGLLILGCLMTHLVPFALATKVPLSNERQTLDHNVNNQELEHSGLSEESLFNDCSSEEEEITPLCLEARRGTNHKQSTDDDLSAKSSLVNQIEMEMHEKETNVRSAFLRLRNSFYQSDFYKDPAINFIILSSAMFGVVHCGWHSFLVPHAIQRGYSMRATILMTLFASVGNFLGRLLAGALSSRLTNPITLFLGAALLNALSILCDVFLHNYYVMIVTAGISAISIAGLSVLGPLAVRNRVSLGNFDLAYAVNNQFFGVGTFFGGYLSGLVSGVFSSYDATFKFLAGADLAVFFLMLPNAVLKKSSDL